MEAESVFRAMLSETSRMEDDELCTLFAEHLRDRDWHVADSNDELRELALDVTDLVEPE